MKSVAIFILLAVHTSLVARYYYISGIKEANFDRQRANIKLQQCSNILAGVK